MRFKQLFELVKDKSMGDHWNLYCAVTVAKSEKDDLVMQACESAGFTLSGVMEDNYIHLYIDGFNAYTKEQGMEYFKGLQVKAKEIYKKLASQGNQLDFVSANFGEAAPVVEAAPVEKEIVLESSGIEFKRVSAEGEIPHGCKIEYKNNLVLDMGATAPVETTFFCKVQCVELKSCIGETCEYRPECKGDSPVEIPTKDHREIRTKADLKEFCKELELFKAMNPMLSMNDCLKLAYGLSLDVELNTYKGWKAKGEQVAKGSRALSFWSKPISKKKKKEEDEQQEEKKKGSFFGIAKLFSKEQLEGSAPAEQEKETAPVPTLEWYRVRGKKNYTAERSKEMVMAEMDARYKEAESKKETMEAPVEKTEVVRADIKPVKSAKVVLTEQTSEKAYHHIKLRRVHVAKERSAKVKAETKQAINDNNLELKKNTRVLSTSTKSSVSYDKAAEERDFNKLGSMEEVKGARVFIGKNGEVVVVYEESEELSQLRSEADKSLEAMRENKSDCNITKYSLQIDYFKKKIAFMQAHGDSHRDIESHERDLLQAQRCLEIWELERDKLPKLDKLTKLTMCNYLNARPKKFSDYEPKSYKKDELKRAVLRSVIDTSNFTGLEAAFPS